VRYFLTNLTFALLGSLFLLSAMAPGFFLFSWVAWIFIFLILLNTQDKPRGVLRLLGWGAAIGYVYFSSVGSFLAPYDLKSYLAALFLSFPALAVYLGLLCVLIPSGRFSLRGPLLAGLIWMGIEWGYGLTPLSGWALQLPFYGPESFLRLASTTGFGLLPGIILAFDFSLAVFIKKREPLAGKAVLVFMLALLAVGGFGMLQSKVVPASDSVRVALIQHNLPASGSWRSAHFAEIREKCFQLAQEALRGNPSLIIFPQYTLPGLTRTNPGFFSDLARQVKRPILLASHMPLDADPDPYTYPLHVNSAILIGPSGEVIDSYRAIRAPFTEKGVQRSEKYKLIEASFGRVGVLLCYEDLFPVVVKKAVAAGAEFLIALSNPGALDGEFVPRQHLLQDQLRSIESDRYLIRVTPNGYSAVLGPSGQILQKTKLQEQEILFATIFKKRNTSVFHRIFYFIPPVYFFLLVGLLFKGRCERVASVPSCK
jgi:apolipoprotein N-acyltransferase